MRLLEKIRFFGGGSVKNDNSSSALSRKFLEQQRFKASHPGSETRKKSFREKREVQKEKSRQKRNQLAGRTTTGRLRVRPASLGVLLALVLSGCYLVVAGFFPMLCGDLHYFRINEIEINGCTVTNPGALRKFGNLTYEMNMLTIDPQAIQSKLKTHPWIAGAAVRRIWPDGIIVTITEYKAQALIVQEGQPGFVYLNRRGIAFAGVTQGQEMDFPVITGIGAFETESQRDALLKTAASFLRLTGRNDPNLPAQNVSEIHFSGEGNLILYLVEYPFPIYFGKGEMSQKYYQLRKVLEVLYRKKSGKAMIEEVAYIRMDYQKNKVLVAKSHAG